VPDVKIDQSTLFTPDEIYAMAVASKPEIKAEEYRLMGTDNSIKIAKSALYPSLSFSAGLGSNYYKTSGFTGDGFGKQLKNNFSQYLGLSLNIPIFNRFSTRNSIRSAQISQHTQQLVLENTKKSLYKEIQQVYYNAIAARSKYESCLVATKSSEDAFNVMSAKYENGKANITEFNESKNNMLKSQSDCVQAKYEYVYRYRTLEFYKGDDSAFQEK
jgi:outer membrane protein